MINLIKKTKSVQLNIKSKVVLFLFILAINVGCHQKKVIRTPEGYDISDPDKIELGSKLDEISGIF